MKLKGKFEKTEVHVGLSSAVPLQYTTPEEKYFLADSASGNSGMIALREQMVNQAEMMVHCHNQFGRLSRKDYASFNTQSADSIVFSDLPKGDDLLRERASKVRFTKTSFVFEFSTSDGLIWSPQRRRCYRYISAMPEKALDEVEEELAQTFQHYIEIEEEQRRAKPIPPKTTEAVVTSISKY